MQNAGPQIRALSFNAGNYALETDQSKNWFSEESLLKNTTDLIQLSDTNENEDADDSSCQEKRSPSVSSVNSESPTPTNSRDGQRWHQDSDHWQQSLMSDEHRQLLGTEEESSDKHSEASHSETSSDSSSEDGDSDSSSPPEEEEIESVYAIRPDQRAYYIERFKQLQSDGSNLLPGFKAKEFFAKSKLPLSELSKIWELSDVTRDGALSIEEFLVAMHLVVLRRNNIPVPDILPPCLNIPVPPTSSVATSVSSVANSVNTVLESRVASDVLIPDLEPSSLEAENKSPVKQRESPVKNEWTKFVESPTAESISSPGPKPVNFDFQKIAIEQDPRIVHPIPRRLTPEMQLDGSSKLHQRPGLRQPSASFASGDDIQGPASLPFSNRKDPPPPPPPRPSKGHARSASLDLNSLGAPYRGTTSQVTAIKPLIPPRVSPSLTPRRAKNQTSLDTNTENLQMAPFQSPAEMGVAQTEVVHAGAFEVYRKTDMVDSSIKPKQEEDVSSQATQSVISRRKRSSLGAIIDQHRTRNEALRRQHRDLLGDLATLLEEKSILEVRLSDQKNC